MSDTIAPAPGYVLVEDVDDSKLASGLVLASDDKSEGQVGKVISIGKTQQLALVSDRTTPTLTEFNSTRGLGRLKIFSLIVFKKYTANKVEYHGNKYKLVYFTDIIGTINEKGDH